MSDLLRPHGTDIPVDGEGTDTDAKASATRVTHRAAKAIRPRARGDAHHRRLEALYAVTRRLAAAQDTEQILSLIVEEATRLLGVEAAGLRLLVGDTLVLKARTDSAAPLMIRTHLKVGESLSGHVVATGEPVVVEDLVQDRRYDPRHRQAALALGYHGFLGVPLRAHDRIVGVLNVYTTQRRSFLADEMALVMAFADQAAIALEKDYLLREARRHATRFQSLARLGQVMSASLDPAEVLRAIANAAADLSAAPAVAVWTADEEGRHLQRRAVSDGTPDGEQPTAVSAQQGLVGWVATTRRLLDVPAVLADPRTLESDWCRSHGLTSACGIPIVAHDRLLGVLMLHARRPFRVEAERNVIEAFTGQAAVAIRNAGLHAEARVAAERLTRRTRELDLLTQMSELLQACVTEEEAYRVVGRFAEDFFPEDVGAVGVTSASRNIVETRAVWGTGTATDWPLFKPEECWALRRGRPHVVDDTASDLLCAHLPSPPPSAFLCIPLTAQGESLGVLSLCARQDGRGWSETRQRLAVTVADQLGLAVANLKLRETLRHQSIRDPLTGLFNRRYMEETLERELLRAERSGTPLGVVMLDLDHFKTFNDTYGHEAGDLLLRELGRFLRGTMRGSDVPCRYGGEELVLILPEASADATRRRAEDICQAIKRLEVSSRGQSLGAVTCSAGVAVFPAHGATGDGLLQAADTALYRAKREGRDRVAVAA